MVLSVQWLSVKERVFSPVILSAVKDQFFTTRSQRSLEPQRARSKTNQEWFLFPSRGREGKRYVMQVVNNLSLILNFLRERSEREKQFDFLCVSSEAGGAKYWLFKCDTRRA